ncbi:MAG: hypothetical protein SF052_15980 [Bacteroidia bacterium]|nr:hypothetical protein [Bacteroidia bacterium]
MTLLLPSNKFPYLTKTRSQPHPAITKTQYTCKNTYFSFALLPASEEGYNTRRADPRLNARDLIRSEYYKLKVYPNPAGLYATFEWDLIHLEGEERRSRKGGVGIFDLADKVVPAYKNTSIDYI